MGVDCREVEGEVTSPQSGRKSVGLPTLAGGKARIWGKTEAQVWVIGLSEQTCQCTGCKVLLFPRLSRGAGVCICELGTSEKPTYRQLSVSNLVQL